MIDSLEMADHGGVNLQLEIEIVAKEAWVRVIKAERTIYSKIESWKPAVINCSTN